MISYETSAKLKTNNIKAYHETVREIQRCQAKELMENEQKLEEDKKRKIKCTIL